MVVVFCGYTWGFMSKEIIYSKFRGGLFHNLAFCHPDLNEVKSPITCINPLLLTERAGGWLTTLYWMISRWVSWRLDKEKFLKSITRLSVPWKNRSSVPSWHLLDKCDTAGCKYISATSLTNFAYLLLMSSAYILQLLCQTCVCVL